MDTRYFRTIIIAFCLLLSMNVVAQTYVTIGQLKYQLDGTEAYVCGYVGSPTDVVIPATIESDGLTFKVTKINTKAFYQCKTLKSVRSEGDNLVLIACEKYLDDIYGWYLNEGAFEGCTSLVSVSFPSVQGIGACSFSGCSNLQYVWLGYNLTYIDSSYYSNGSNHTRGAFAGCNMLSYIVIPASCTSLGSAVFSGCDRLQAIIYLGNQTSKCGSNANVYNINNMIEWSESCFAYSGSAPTPTFTNNLPLGFQANANAAQGNLEKNVGTYSTTVPITFANTEQTFTVDIPFEYTITPITLTAQVKNSTKVYGEANPKFLSEYSGFITGEDASVITTEGTYSTTATTKSDVGNYSVTQSGASAKNYVFSYKSGTLTVTKAPLTMTPRDKTMSYGDALPTFDADYAGLKNSETNPAWTTAPNITTTATQQSGAGTYPITVSGGVARNYDVTFKTGTLTITKASLTATTKNATREYGDDNPDFELTYSGLKNGETEPEWAVLPSIASPATKTSPVGTYAITATGGETKNYNVQFMNKGELTVTKAPLTATARSFTKTQGDSNPTLVIDYDGFKNGETKNVLTQEPVISTTATKDSRAGTYPIVVSGGVAMNYEFNYVNGTMTIKPRESQTDPTANVLSVGNASGNKNKQAVLPIALTNEQEITGLQFDLYLPTGVTVATNDKGKMLISTTNRMEESYTLTGSVMENGKYVRVVGYSGDSDPFTGSSGDILEITLNIGEYVADGDYTVFIKDIVLSDVTNTEYHPANADGKLTLKSFTLGDVDDSGAVNINDVVCIINYILNKPNGVFIEEAADVDQNGSININDVVTLINRFILHRNNARAMAPAKAKEKNTDAITDENYLHLPTIDINPGEEKEVELLMDNAAVVSAIEGRIVLPEGLSFVTKSNGRMDVKNNEARAEDFTLSCALQEDGSMIFAQYSGDGFEYEGNSGKLFTFKIKADENAKPGKYEVELTDVVLSIGGVGYEYASTTSQLNILGDITVEGIELPESTFEMDLGDTKTLSVTFSPEDATDKTLRWESSDESVATVNENGEVTAVGAGTAVITATSMENAEATVQCTVTVKAYSLTYVVDGEEYKTVTLGKGETISPETEPTKEGHTFSGWSEIPETMPANDVTVTGTFTVNKYKLTYTIDGVEYKTVEVEYGANITPEPTPDGDYDTFEWVGVPETMPAQDVTVTASYTTGIRSICLTQPTDVYTLTGNKVRTNTMTLKGLPRGVYVVNGRKVVVE